VCRATSTDGQARRLAATAALGRGFSRRRGACSCRGWETKRYPRSVNRPISGEAAGDGQ